MNIRLLKSLLLLLVIGIFCVLLPTAKAVDGLDNPQDVLVSSTVGMFTQHAVSFGLPSTSPPVTINQYIILDFPQFSNVGLPTHIVGDYGYSPTYNQQGNRIIISNVFISPGEKIHIEGISASNPASEDQYDVYISISTDPEGNNIRNSAHVLASVTDGTVTVSALLLAPVGTLRVSGKTSPGTFVTFTEAGSVVGTTSADSTGNFTQEFPNMLQQVHDIIVFGTDGSNRTSATITVEVFTRSYELTEVSGILLPPTLSVDKDQISRGDSITISGRGVPGYRAIIFTEPPLSTIDTFVDENGDFSRTINDTNSMQLGDHSAYALVQDDLGAQSLFSLASFFRVVDTTPSGDGPGCDISRGDVNCDDIVSLADFSILLYYWGGNSSAADINSDGLVNLVDFSIMMFYWS